jgi:rhodanese-related sulfurtransferase
LIQQGIDAVNLDGGLVAWARAGRALVSDGDRPPAVL